MTDPDTRRVPMWRWMMDWCKAKGLAPADPANWEAARKAYDTHKRRPND